MKLVSSFSLQMLEPRTASSVLVLPIGEDFVGSLLRHWAEDTHPCEGCENSGAIDCGESWCPYYYMGIWSLVPSIGHQGMADLLTSRFALSRRIEMRRENVWVYPPCPHRGDRGMCEPCWGEESPCARAELGVVVAQLRGGRLPEGKILSAEAAKDYPVEFYRVNLGKLPEGFPKGWR